MKVTKIKIKAPEHWNLLDPAVIAKRVRNGNRLNREMAKLYPNHQNWMVYR
jgi:hypothetical protein